MNAEATETKFEPTQWFENHHAYLVRFALSKVGDMSLAEDLVQETFLAAWKGRKKFQGRSTERTWLTRILINKIADHFRLACNRPSSRTISFSETENPEELVDALNYHQGNGKDQEDPLSQTQLAETMAIIDQALDDLPERTAKAFRMREFQGKSTADISSMLNISRAHLWVLIHRARQGLRRHFDSIGEPVSTAVTSRAS